MNAARRKEIDRALSLLGEARAILENERDAEQEYRDNMPDAFASGEKGDNADSAISNLDDAINEIESAESNAEEAKS